MLIEEIHPRTFVILEVMASLKLQSQKVDKEISENTETIGLQITTFQ